MLTYRQIAQLASAALGKRSRTVTIPVRAVRTSVWVATSIGGRPANIAEFFADGLTRDAVGQRYGELHIDAYFGHLSTTLCGKLSDSVGVTRPLHHPRQRLHEAAGDRPTILIETRLPVVRRTMTAPVDRSTPRCTGLEQDAGSVDGESKCGQDVQQHDHRCHA